MRSITGYLELYWKELDKLRFFIAVIFIAILIFCNYYFHVNDHIVQLDKPTQYIAWYGIFFFAFVFGYVLLLFDKPGVLFNRSLLLLILIAPLIFSWKITAGIHFFSFDDAAKQRFWNMVIYYPTKLIVVSSVIFLIWKMMHDDEPFYISGLKQTWLKPYLLMLLIMVPLIAMASVQKDFLAAYPKFKTFAYINQPGTALYKILYELSYGSDFFTIEIFFRGFLIIAFARYAGTNAILPMALFYCTIHFGKPLGECISSFFGGIILGVVTYHTRTIWGGLVVHLGIAWMMEVGGYLGSKI